MPTELVVTRPFGTYKVGDRITDQAAIAKILASSNHANVVPAKSPSPVPPAPVALAAG